MTKNKLAFIGIVVLILLGISLYFNWNQFKTNKQQSARIENLSTNTNSGNAKIEYRYLDKDSNQHAVASDVPVKTNAEKALAVGTGYTDTVVKALKVALNQITELTKVNAQLVATVKLQNESVATITNDSPRLQDLKTYSDKYLSLVYKPSIDSLSLSYNVALNQAQYWKRSWLLAPKKYYIDLWSEDPRVNINNVKRFTTNFPTKSKRFGIGPSIGWGYIPALNKGYVFTGISAHYDLVQF